MNMVITGIQLLTALIPVQLYFNIYGNLYSSAAQLLSVILIAIFLYDMSKNNRLSFIFETAIDRLVIVFIGILFIGAVLVSGEKALSIKFFIKATVFISLYFVVSKSISKISDLENIIKTAVVTAFALSFLGIVICFADFSAIFKFVTQNPLSSNINNPKTIKEKVVSHGFNFLYWNWSDPATGYVRAFSTFYDAIDLSAYLGLMLPFAAWYIVEQTGKPVLKALMIITSLICIVFTMTRSAYVALAVTTVTLIIGLYKVFNRKMFILLISALLILLGIVSPVFIKNIEKRFSDDSKTEFTRPRLWQDGLRVFMINPIMGIGTANYKQGLVQCGIKEYFLPAHNQYIQIAAENGLIGLICYIAILFSGVACSYKIFIGSNIRKLQLLSLGFIGMWSWYLTQSFFATYLFGDKFSMMFWLMVGLNAALYRMHLAEPSVNLKLNQTA